MLIFFVIVILLLIIGSFNKDEEIRKYSRKELSSTAKSGGFARCVVEIIKSLLQ